MQSFDAKFVKEATAAGFVNLKDTVQFWRNESIYYNAMPKEGVEKLCRVYEEV